MNNELERYYSKSQLLTSNKYTASQKDIIGVLLRQDKNYTHAEAAEIINNFLNQEAI